MSGETRYCARCESYHPAEQACLMARGSSSFAAPLGSACCDYMQFALRHAIIRQINGPYFGSDVLPPQLTKNIVACPWCGKVVTPNGDYATGSHIKNQIEPQGPPR